jgi:hypothetical protein
MGKASSRSDRRALQRLNAAALTVRGRHQRAKRLVDCVLQDEKKEATGYRTWRCQHRNCLFCCWKYWRGFIENYLRKINKLTGNDYRLSFLTLTIPNVLSLSPDLYRELAANLKKMMRRYPFKCRVVGAVARIETDYNSHSQDFHIHIHIILIYSQCIPQKEIVEAWSDVMGPQPSVYELSDVPGRESKPCVVWIEKIKPGTLRRTVRYVFKFEPFEEAEAFAEYDCAVRNVRLVQSFGALFERNRKARRG